MILFNSIHKTFESILHLETNKMFLIKRVSSGLCSSTHEGVTQVNISVITLLSSKQNQS